MLSLYYVYIYYVGIAMLCPRCQVPLTVSECLYVEVKDCPQCSGAWIETAELEKISEQIPDKMKSGETFDKSLADSQTNIDQETSQNNAEQNSPNTGRKHQHFLAGAFDVSDDW